MTVLQKVECRVITVDFAIVCKFLELWLACKEWKEANICFLNSITGIENDN